MTLQVNNHEERIIRCMRALPKPQQDVLMDTLERLLEEMEDAEDLAVARARMNEPRIPAEEVYRKLGLR